MKEGRLKYKEVEKEVRQLAMTLPPGAQIPPERHLAVTYDCNFLTIRRALKSLVDDETIVRKVGSGTFVNDRKRPPAPAARTRESTLPNRIGLLVYHQGNAYAHKLLQSLAHAAMEQRLDLRSAWVRDFRDDAPLQAAKLERDGCCSLVLPWFPHTQAGEVQAFVRRSSLPCCIPLPIAGLERNYFGRPESFGHSLLDSIGALCRYFQALGRARIAFVGPATPQDHVLQITLSAYTYFVSSSGLPNLSALIPPDSASIDRLAEQWRAYRGELAVVAYDDEHALRLMTAMHKIGMHAPGDYALVGRNDMEAGHFSDPPLSTISQDFESAARGLLENAVALAQGGLAQLGDGPPTRLIVRGTCGGAGRLDQRLRATLPELVFVEGTPDTAAAAPTLPIPVLEPGKTVTP